MGYGDDMIATGEAHRLAEAAQGRPVLVGDGERVFWSPIFLLHPSIRRSPDSPAGADPAAKPIWLHHHPGRRPYLLRREADRDRFRVYAPPRGVLRFSRLEAAWARARARRLGPFCVVEPNVKGNHSADNKQWGPDRYQAVVDRLAGEIGFIQFDTGPQRLRGATLVRAPSFRHAAALLGHARLYLGPEGGLHHAAAALDRPAVVLYGGWVTPRATGYADHLNLYRALPGSPCGRHAPCDHCRRAMAAITVDEVCDGVGRLLAEARAPCRPRPARGDPDNRVLRDLVDDTMAYLARDRWLDPERRAAAAGAVVRRLDRLRVARLAERAGKAVL